MADEKKVPYLTVNYDAKTFTINEAVKPTAQDEDMITRYLRAGFKMRYKSVVRTANATKKALTNEVIIAELKKSENPLALVKYLSIKSNKGKDANGKRDGGFFKAKTWYEKEFKADTWKPDNKEIQDLESKKKELLDALKEKEEKAKEEKAKE